MTRLKKIASEISNEEQQLISELKQIAMDNYENGGDGYVEAYDDKDWVSYIKRCKENNENPKEEIYKDMKTSNDRNEEMSGWY